MKARSVGQIAVGQARFEAYDVKKITLFLGFCCVDFITSKNKLTSENRPVSFVLERLVLRSQMQARRYA